jgi:hypothetical protein
MALRSGSSLTVVLAAVLTGCAATDHSTDYSARKRVLLAPLVVAADQGEHERRLSLRRWLYTGLVNEMADNGYSLFIADDFNPNLTVTQAQIKAIKSGQRTSPIAPSTYDYVAVFLVEKNEAGGIPVLLERGQAAVSLYIIDNRSQTLHWSSSASRNWGNVPIVIVIPGIAVYSSANFNAQDSALAGLMIKLLKASPFLAEEAE